MPDPDSLRYLVGHGLKIDTKEGLAVIEAEIATFRPEFIVVGNLREIHTKDENRPEMALVRDAFRNLSRQYGCSFIVIHHFRKDAEGQSKRKSQMMAGSGIWGAWIEGWMWVLPGASDLQEVDTSPTGLGITGRLCERLQSRLWLRGSLRFPSTSRLVRKRL